MTPPSLDSEFTVKDKPTPALPILFTRARRLLGSGLQTCWNRLHRNRFAALRYGFLFMVLWSWLLYIVVAFLIPPTPVLIPPSLLYAKRPLLVVAHPDDESLFFGPTLLSLTRWQGTSLNILVLSSGTTTLISDFVLEHVRSDIRSRKQLRPRQHPQARTNTILLSNRRKRMHCPRPKRHPRQPSPMVG